MAVALGDEPHVFRPAAMDPLVHRLRSEAGLVGGVYHGDTSIRVPHKPVASSVSGLLPQRSPTAIFWSVVPIVVDAVECRSRRSLAHISKEVFELVPPFADLDPTAAVMPEASMIWIAASLPHVDPCVIFGAANTVPLKAVGREPLPGIIAMKAAATACCTEAKLLAINDTFVPAYAAAVPIGLVGMWPACFLKHCQATETLSGEVEER